jgi:urease accessory protein
MEVTTVRGRRRPFFATRPVLASPIIGTTVMSMSTSSRDPNATNGAPIAPARWSSTLPAAPTRSPATTDALSFSSGNDPSRSSIDDLDLDQKGWRAELSLGFGVDDAGATHLDTREHRGPLVVQRPFYPEGAGVPHVYVLHPPGGLVGGDRLRLDVAVGPGAHALGTTPAASKFYRSLGPVASQRQRFRLGRGAAFEWLPQETILHDGAAADLVTEVALADGARFVGMEILCFGLPARGETFATGRCRHRLEIWRDDRPIVVERGRFDAGDRVHAAAWGLGGARVHGLMVVSPAPLGEEPVARARAAAVAAVADLGSEVRAGITVLGEGDALVCRYVGAGAEAARTFFHSVWAAIRPVVMGRPAVPPRIWAT